MVKPLFDTNILIDYLNGHAEARDELSRYEATAISIVTWMEVMVGAPEDLAKSTRNFLAGFDVVEADAKIAERAVEIRKRERIRLPDAIIWASAEVNGFILVTRNTKDFPADHPGVRVPYKL